MEFSIKTGSTIICGVWCVWRVVHVIRRHYFSLAQKGQFDRSSHPLAQNCMRQNVSHLLVLQIDTSSDCDGDSIDAQLKINDKVVHNSKSDSNLYILMA